MSIKIIGKGCLYTLFVVLLLVIDQSIKLWVKNNMCLHESIHITDWFYLLYIENNGMAYGMTFIPKYALTVFRMCACVFLIYYIGREIYRGARDRWLVLLSMILAGAAGNLIDCMFYGVWFHETPFLQGRVVDMFYFPLIETTYPEWFPIWGGEPYIFFAPVFNFADACISVAVVALIIFCGKEMESLRS